MLHVLYYALGFLAWYGQTAFSNPTTYDQRQTGDLNVQIHLKDVQVVALLDSELLEDYTDYDYSYDYADFTIKPIVKPTTSSPVSTSSVKPWNTWPTNPSTESTTASSSSIEDASSTSENTEQAEPATSPSSLDGQEVANATDVSSEAPAENNETLINVRINDKVIDELFKHATVDTTNEKEEESVATSSEAGSKKKCPSGYTLTKKGGCRSTQHRRRISLVPLSMKLGSRLSQKGRFSVRKDLPIRVYKSEARP